MSAFNVPQRKKDFVKYHCTFCDCSCDGTLILIDCVLCQTCYNRVMEKVRKQKRVIPPFDIPIDHSGLEQWEKDLNKDYADD